MNTLYYGDNLDVLRQHIKDCSVDLIYLDPPFNSSRSYNIIFDEQNGTGAASQIKAFEDTWHWDQTAAHAYHHVVELGGTNLSYKRGRAPHEDETGYNELNLNEPQL